MPLQDIIQCTEMAESAIYAEHLRTLTMVSRRLQVFLSICVLKKCDFVLIDQLISLNSSCFNVNFLLSSPEWWGVGWGLDYCVESNGGLQGKMGNLVQLCNIFYTSTFAWEIRDWRGTKERWFLKGVIASRSTKYIQWNFTINFSGLSEKLSITDIFSPSSLLFPTITVTYFVVFNHLSKHFSNSSIRSPTLQYRKPYVMRSVIVNFYLFIFY